jgi:hypothetical protein
MLVQRACGAGAGYDGRWLDHEGMTMKLLQAVFTVGRAADHRAGRR